MSPVFLNIDQAWVAASKTSMDKCGKTNKLAGQEMTNRSAAFRAKCILTHSRNKKGSYRRLNINEIPAPEAIDLGNTFLEYKKSTLHA